MTINPLAPSATQGWATDVSARPFAPSNLRQSDEVLSLHIATRAARVHLVGPGLGGVVVAHASSPQKVTWDCHKPLRSSVGQSARSPVAHQHDPAVA